jgi:hypothetical protein
MTIKQLVILGIGIILASLVISCNEEATLSKPANYQIETQSIWVGENALTIIKGSDNKWYLKHYTYQGNYVYIPYNSDL